MNFSNGALEAVLLMHSKDNNSYERYTRRMYTSIALARSPPSCSPCKLCKTCKANGKTGVGCSIKGSCVERG